MEQYKQEFIEFMVDCGVLKFGDFVTKSGRNTPFFVNTGFYRTGAQLGKLGEYYARTINEKFGTDFDILFGPAYKGIPLSVATSMQISALYEKDVKYCSNRKEVKDTEIRVFFLEVRYRMEIRLSLLKMLLLQELLLTRHCRL